MDRFSRQNIYKETVDLNDILDQMESWDIYRTLHLKIAKYKFFSSTHVIFTRIDQVRPQIHINKFNKIEIISSIISEHNGKKINQFEETQWKKHKHMMAKQPIT